MSNSISPAAYRALRRVYLNTCRAYRLGSVWGPAEPAKLKEEQRRLAALRVSVRA